MNTKLKHLAIIGYMLVSTVQLHAQGYIVPNGVTNMGIPFETEVLHDPTFTSITGYYAAFLFTPINSNTFLFDTSVDPTGVRVFLVSSNAPISLQPILSQSYTELLPSPTAGHLFQNGIPFYVGLYTGNNPGGPVNGIYSYPLFGWAELENVSGTIQLLNSALEYQGGGIYAGTQTIIPTPEPSVISLSVVSGLLILWRTRKMRS